MSVLLYPRLSVAKSEGDKMQEADYPALFLSADEASNNYQALFLRLIKIEYAALFFAAVFSMSFLHGVGYYITYAIILVVGLATLLTRALRKPEQDWYRCRALAESVKTLTWRYLMHATPFQNSTGGEQQAKAELRNQLHSIFDENRTTAEKITSDWSGNDQITAGMDVIRNKNRRDRMAYYLTNRVDEQRRWYALKARQNKDRAKFWVGISVVAYVFGGTLALCRIAYPTWQYWPIEPLIVIAASVVGWMQIKKFNELTAVYTVAAHEIGLIKPRSEAVKSDDDFSEFVNDAEKAFSREHTLWIARQSD
jgi:ribosomal protein S17E